MRMKIGYIIHAYKNPKQLKRLVLTLADRDINFFIHIDKKIDIRPFNDELKTLNINSITWVKREYSNWGTFACVRAVLNALEAGLKHDPKIDYFYCLSGQDYPIKSNSEIAHFLEKFKDRSFVLHFPLPYSGWKSGGLHRFARYHFIISKNRYIRRIVNILNFFLPRRHFPLGMRPYGGDFYMGLNRAAAEFVVAFQSANPDFNAFFNYVYIPEELYFPSLLLSADAAEQKLLIENRALTRSDWTKPKGPYPATMEYVDMEALSREDYLFARKFDINLTPEIFDQLDFMRNNDQ